ncbi:tyrosine-type recombinase/integrase [Acidithiobacillus ferriphilus]|uniref:tyrosine-type recombinase/integrase n=1 Tax=Acidithiobacillus ferriphilus TaxID=1689834 RepID=UPI001D0209B1|nr:hypothetical protein [Acidithiobacillus ferriphilus]MDA8182439.1 hypothetical protein [Acidithiobacillus sp.]
MERYLVEVSPLKKSHKQESYRITDWKQRPIAQRYLASIRGKDVADTVREMQSEGKSANTISLHLAILSHLFTIARKEWGMESLVNPVELVRKPKKPQGRDRRLVDDEEQRLLDACRATNPELAHIVTIAIETAMRQGEIIGMTWDLSGGFEKTHCHTVNHQKRLETYRTAIQHSRRHTTGHAPPYGW